ncbi:hypothetical protein ACIBL3_11705 [Kribbella sp. NPDC050124]|uniref:hypothetical protein n=1 Tax=Kribbella sp. NPDC050124 TaxID=3364114 RepID=UPI0037BD97E6
MSGGLVAAAAVIVGLLGAAHLVLSDSPYLLVVGAVYLLTMLPASLRYWFNVPSTGLALATLLYLVGAVLGATGVA